MKAFAEEHAVYVLLAILFIASVIGLAYRNTIAGMVRRVLAPPVEHEPIEHFHVDPIVIRGVFPRAPKATPVPPPGASGVPFRDDGRAGL